MSSHPEVPLLAPPSGVKPNFVNPQSIGPIISAIAEVCVVLMFSMVMIRVISKVKTPSLFGWDDCERCSYLAPLFLAHIK